MIKEIMKSLEEKGYEVTETKVEKGGIVKDGIVVKLSATVSPVVYVDENTTLDDVEQQIRIAKIQLDKMAEIGESMKNFDNIKDKLRVAVRPTILDVESSVVTKKFLDIEMYCEIAGVVDDDEASFTVKVKNDLLETWGISADEMFDIAIDNTEKLFTAKSMKEVLAELMGCDADEVPEPPTPFLMITTGKVHGAAAILMTEKLAEVAEMVESDLYIIPSSIHELLTVPVGSLDADELSNMICEVNEGDVQPEDRLSSHPYIFKRDVGEVELV